MVKRLQAKILKSPRKLDSFFDIKINDICKVNYLLTDYIGGNRC